MKLNSKLFTTARIKLTLVYLLGVMAVTSSFSFVFYNRTVGVIEREFEKIESRLEQNQDDEGRVRLGGPQLTGLKLTESQPGDLQLFEPQPHQRFQLFQENFEEAKSRIFWQLVQVNATVGVLFLFVGFYLSGLTLAPIEKVWQKQKKFVADAAHELRTPLAALKTNIEVNLLDKKISQNTQDILQSNLQDLTNLEVLVESLLTLAQVDERRLELDEVNLGQIVKKVTKQVQPLAQKKNIKVKLAADKAQKIKVKADLNLLTELLVILIDNAIKYSPQNSEVKIDFKKSSGKVKILIKDQGVGISKKHQKKIFERFYRVDQARTRGQKDTGGYGLGLSIASRIASLHKGQITVESKVGAGATFVVSLPA